MLSIIEKREIKALLGERDKAANNRVWNRKELKEIKLLIKMEKCRETPRLQFIHELEKSYSFGEAHVDEQTDTITRLSFAGIARTVNVAPESVSYYHKSMKKVKNDYGFDQYCASL
ncbi:MAG: hypothetical protein ACUZ8H_03865 [Candidatus Anammoxibacter sp.]